MSQLMNGSSKREIYGLLAAVGGFALVLLMPTSEALGVDGKRMAALFVLIIVLWSTEAIPIAIASLLAIVMQPILNLTDINRRSRTSSTLSFSLF